MLSVEAAVSFYGEVDGVALLLLVILLVSRGVVLHLPERLEGHEDRFLLHRLLLRVWPVVRPVEGLVEQASSSTFLSDLKDTRMAFYCIACSSAFGPSSDQSRA
jgi:hypothetical protein